MKKTILFLIFALLISGSQAANYIVINGNDAGAGSLRQAITDANAGAGSDMITFSIPVTDPSYDPIRKVWILNPATTYPYITGANITIDGNSQTLNQGDSNTYGPEIFIDGQSTLANAFIIATSGNIIKGLVISRCTYAIVFYNGTAANNQILQCYIGTDETGSIAMGNQVGIGASGGATNNTISDNLISGNTQSGIAIQGAGYTIIRGNYIGTDHTGTLALPNYYGIALDDAYNNTIGGNLPAHRNLISGNASVGIAMNGASSTNNIVSANYIGTDTSGTLPVPNDFGLVLIAANGNTIGGSVSTERNIISGNLSGGILLNGSGTENNSIKGNYIGLDVSGSLELHNHVGILLKSNADNNAIGGPIPGDRNVISGNDEIGVYLEASDFNIVMNNYIGPDATGLNPIMVGDSMFQGNGIELNTVSQYNTVEDNVISGNRVYGFVFYGQVSYNDLINNYIGTDATGNVAMKNATGICVDGASNHNNILGNVLSGNLSYGIFIVTTGTYYNVVQGNMIGTNAAGTDTIPNDIGLTLGGGARYNIVGGLDPGEANVISGNRYDGVEIADNLTDFNEITGNFIGTNFTGTQALPNVNGIGIATFPANNLIHSNLISGNSQLGIILYENADSNTISNNIIGTDISGQNPLPNGLSGVLIMEGASHNKIVECTIAYNGVGGVVIMDNDSRFNTISANCMHDNDSLSGIDLFPFGCNANDGGDSDSGPNDLLNYPNIQVVAFDSLSGVTSIWGTVDLADPDSAWVEVFIAQPDPLGCGEGKTYLGRCMANSSHVWVLVSSVPVITDQITTTATDKYGNTSEFSPLYNVSHSDGIQDKQEMNDEISAFPNPFHDQLQIDLGENHPVTIEIYNVTGIRVFEEKNPATGQMIWNTDASVLPGLYLIRLLFENAEPALLKVIKSAQ